VSNKKTITIRKAADWRGRPVWRWRCNTCPVKKGRKPTGGDHRCSTFTSRNRGDKYPRAYDRCLAAAKLHLHRKHDPRVIAARQITVWRRADKAHGAA
jgi:hypothetical protein